MMTGEVMPQAVQTPALAAVTCSCTASLDAGTLKQSRVVSHQPCVQPILYELCYLQGE